MTVIELSTDALRSVLLESQGLLEPPTRPAVKADVLDSIRRMHSLQIDTISVVARAPYFILWSRLGEYDPAWLDELQAEAALFEYWSHAACFLPMENYPYYRRLMIDQQQPSWYRNSRQWLDDHPELVERVLKRLHDQGAVRSVDFPREDKGGLWWDRKPEKRALEHLFNHGEVMIARREKFQRVYALRQSVRPDWRDDAAPPYEEVVRVFALKAVQALGVAIQRWVPDYFRLKASGDPNLLETMADEGALLRVQIEGWNEPGFAHPEKLDLLQSAQRGNLHSTVTTLLSPFDPVVWDRVRLKDVFDFEYSLECYLPAPKRRYGYFLLPILHHGKMIGRLDAKAHRPKKRSDGEGCFEIKVLYLEPRIPIDDGLSKDLAGMLCRCAEWHQTPRIVIRRSDPPQFAKRLAAQDVRIDVEPLG
jgi:uncharacterized protein